jgi:hypothetical protein
MVNVNISPIPPKIIGIELCLQARNLSGLPKDPGLKKCPNT